MKKLNRFILVIILFAYSTGLFSQQLITRSNYADNHLYNLQQEFLDLRFGLFICMNISNYGTEDWAEPNSDPALFNPVNLDCDQWAKAALSAGMTYGVLTTKHHDGFLLWDSKTTDYDVGSSPYKKDIVREYVDAFRRHGLKPVLYYSILDLTAGIKTRYIGRKEIELIKAQLTELLTKYGEIPALVLDAWDAEWSRISYDEVPFEEIYRHIKKLQPNCLVNDHNAAKYPHNTLFYSDFKQYEQRAGQLINTDSKVPAQSGNTLQRSWFWKENMPTDELKDVNTVVNEWLIPFNKIHCNFLLNVAINREGKIDQNALDRLAEIGKAWKHPGSAPKFPRPLSPVISSNIAKMKKANASSHYDTSAADYANDDNWNTAWVARYNDETPWFEILFDKKTELNMIAFSEPSVHRKYNSENKIKSYTLQFFNGKKWIDIAEGGNVQNTHIHRFENIKAEKVRILITSFEKFPGIAEFGVYLEKAL